MPRRLLLVAIGAAATAGLIAAAAATSSPTAAARCLGKRATTVGTARANNLNGTANADVIAGLGGADYLDGRGGNDLLCGGAGDDVINGGPGVDRIDGGRGFDVCRGGEHLVSCEETAPALPLHGKIRPGRYTPDLFKPRIAFTLGGIWYADEQASGHVDVEYSSTTGPDLDFDSLAAGNPVQAVVSAITAEAGLNPTTPAPVKIGTAAGYEFEVSIPVTGHPIFVPDTASYEFDPGDHGRIFVVSASGRTVVVISGTTADQYASGSVTIDTVLATVKWER